MEENSHIWRDLIYKMNYIHTLCYKDMFCLKYLIIMSVLVQVLQLLVMIQSGNVYVRCQDIITDQFIAYLGKLILENLADMYKV